ncbi:MAG TPA: DNA alkylation repair protein, partial [Blastocatellia bacterium]|nr:DNA alkylation repair protein [Blastocatellia bacterium]
MRTLQARGHHHTRAQSSKFFKPHEKIWTFGVSTPEFRRIEKDLYLSVRKQWNVTDALTFCDHLVRTRYMESKAV